MVLKVLVVLVVLGVLVVLVVLGVQVPRLRRKGLHRVGQEDREVLDNPRQGVHGVLEVLHGMVSRKA